jgi:hypothetical protein
VLELFHHQDTFFGCLTIQRLRRPPATEVARTSEFDALAAALWHRLPQAGPDSDDVLLATRAFDLELSERCPALNAEQGCSLQDRGKPVVCRVVPLDALQPDSAQAHVLQSRSRDARSFGSDCIQPGVHPGWALVTRRLQVVAEDARATLAAHRRALAAERSLWGDAVFGLMSPELFASQAALERLPAAGFMTLPLAPVLMVLARRSAAARARCVAYLDAQATLAERLLTQAREQGHAQTESVQRLAAFARSNAHLALQLKE